MSVGLHVVKSLIISSAKGHRNKFHSSSSSQLPVGLRSYYLLLDRITRDRDVTEISLGSALALTLKDASEDFHTSREGEEGGE